MSFLEHLEVLRWHLLRSAIAIIVVAIAMFVYNDIIFDTILFAPKDASFITYQYLCKLGRLLHAEDQLCITSMNFELINTDLSGQFMTHVWVSLVGGLVITSPYVIWEMWRFIRPALHDNEKKNSRGFVFASSLLFIAGVVFSYYVVVPFTVYFLGTYQVSAQVKNMISMGSYISNITMLCLLMGIVFQLPVVVHILSKLGVLSPQFMRKYRRHAFLIILIVAAIITPQDVFSMILVTIPLYALYEVSIFVSKKAYKL